MGNEKKRDYVALGMIKFPERFSEVSDGKASRLDLSSSPLPRLHVPVTESIKILFSSSARYAP